MGCCLGGAFLLGGLEPRHVEQGSNQRQHTPGRKHMRNPGVDVKRFLQLHPCKATRALSQSSQKASFSP